MSDLGEEVRKRVWQLASVALHVRNGRNSPQILLEAVEHRGPHSLLLDPLQALVSGLVRTRSLSGVQFDFSVSPRHVVDVETPRRANIIGHLRVAPSEGVVRLVVVVGTRIIKHDDIADFSTTLNGLFLRLALEQAREGVSVLDSLVDNGICARQV